MAVLGVSLQWLFGWCSQSPPNEPNIDIKYGTIISTPYRYDSKGSLHLDYETDKIFNLFYFQIINKGKGPAKHFKIDIRTGVKEIKIIDKHIVFEPFGIEENIKPAPQKNDNNRFYRLIDPFPGGESKIFLSLEFSKQISESDLKYSFISYNRRWTAYKDEINIRNPLSFFEGYPEVVSVAYAQEINKLDKEADLNKLKSFWTGGYYPLLLSYGLFDLLRNRETLIQSEIKEIENMIESFEMVSRGVSISGGSGPISSLFRGFSFLRFHEIILNALIRKKIISFEEANKILKIAREAGGTKFSGYNVIILDVEILNHLIRKDYISRAEGQQIIDNAKVKKEGK